MSYKKSYSPLRYPGGKAILATFMKDVIMTNHLEGGKYCEAYAGGAGAALDLLISRTVKEIFLNDIDYHIYSFWVSILTEKDEFISKIRNTPIDIETWHFQQLIYKNPTNFSQFEVGFSTFFLNRCNRSGILTKAGPIGGINQTGKYLIDARFNKSELINRIELINKYSRQIHVSNFDALTFIDKICHELNPTQFLLYLDPPYYNKGKTLYLNFYDHKDHQDISSILNSLTKHKWLVSYDNVPEIKELYKHQKTFSFDLNYSLQKSRRGSELMIFSPSISIPDTMQVGRRFYELLL